MSAHTMLVIEVSQIAPEGLDVDAALSPDDVHVAGEEAFVLEQGRLACHLEKGEEETVHVTGRLGTRLGLECGRCLEPFGHFFDQDLDLFFLAHRPDEDGEEEEEVELQDHEVVVGYYREGRLDLGEVVREQLFLNVPQKPLCREDCRGLCRSCGANRNQTTCECPDTTADARLLPLLTLFDKRSS